MELKALTIVEIGGLVLALIGLAPWLLEKRGMSPPYWTVLVGGCLAVTALGILLYGPVRWLASQIPGLPADFTAAIMALFVGIAATWWIMYPAESSKIAWPFQDDWDASNLKFKPVVSKTFTDEEVPLDGFTYSDCTFKNVTFIWKGEQLGQLIGNHFVGPGPIVFKVPKKLMAIMKTTLAISEAFAMKGAPVMIIELPAPK